MTHRQTWREIAEAYLTPENERRGKQEYLAYWGLCSAVDDLGLDIGRELGALNPKPQTDGFWLPVPIDNGLSDCSNHTRKHDLIRGTFACLVAAMTEKEFNSLLAPQVPPKRKQHNANN